MRNSKWWEGLKSGENELVSHEYELVSGGMTKSGMGMNENKN